VESEGELMLVNICEPFPDLFCIDLFQLNKKAKEWVKLKDIGDRVFFRKWMFVFCICFGIGSSQRKLYCIFLWLCPLLWQFGTWELYFFMIIFYLDQDRLSHVSEYSQYFNLFLPPEWILKNWIWYVMLSCIRFLMW
jgi:hypothetical protein